MLVIIPDIRDGLGLVNGNHSNFLRSALPAKIPEDEEGAAESSDEDNRDGNSRYSPCSNTVRVIVAGLDDGSVARGLTGDCAAGCVGMRYGYYMAWHRRVESCL